MCTCPKSLVGSALPELVYAEERVDAEDESAEERDGRVEDSLSEVRANGKRWGYGSGKCEGSMNGTFGGRAKDHGGEESDRKKASLSDTDLARAEREKECTACNGDEAAEVVSGVGSRTTRSAAIIAARSGELRWFSPTTGGVGARGWARGGGCEYGEGGSARGLVVRKSKS